MKKKPRTNGDHRRSTSANQLRQPWDDSFQLSGSVEGPISPVNYAGTQINIWGIPGGNLTEGLLHVADPSRNPNFGYMTEEMIKVKTNACAVTSIELLLVFSAFNRRFLHRHASSM